MNSDELRQQALAQKKLAEQQEGLVDQLVTALKKIREDNHFEENIYKSMVQR